VRLDAIDENGRILETSTNLPIDVTVKTRRNQAAVNRLDLGNEIKRFKGKRCANPTWNGLQR
jgi:hypothetical protein